MIKLRYWLIGRLLSKQERIYLYACISDQQYALNNYTENMGESVKELAIKLKEFKDEL